MIEWNDYHDSPFVPQPGLYLEASLRVDGNKCIIFEISGKVPTFQGRQLIYAVDLCENIDKISRQYPEEPNNANVEMNNKILDLFSDEPWNKFFMAFDDTVDPSQPRWDRLGKSGFQMCTGPSAKYYLSDGDCKLNSSVAPPVIKQVLVNCTRIKELQ